MTRGSGARIAAATAAASLVLAGCAQPPGGTPSTGVPTSPGSAVTPTVSSPTPSPTPHVACLTEAQQLSQADQVGQLYMEGVAAGVTVDQAAEDLAAGSAGSVILVGDRTDGLAATAQFVEQLQAAVPGEPLLIAVDQEGGAVQRLRGEGFSDIPAAAEQGQWADADLGSAWRTWGSELGEAGANIDLAPVADVVPADQVPYNAAIGQLQRGYGDDPAVVAAKVTQVVEGLGDAGVASSVKHFPGLGQVPENTDDAIGRDQVSTLTDDELVSFEQAIEAGANSVMVSSAIYTQVDPDHPAVFSQTIVTGILRQRMGFDGVVISDDLGVAAAVADYPADQRGTMFLRAGGDLVVAVDPDAVQAMVAGTLAEAQADPLFADELAVKAARVLALKQEVGLLSCA